MDLKQQKELTDLLGKYSKSEGVNATAIPGVSIFKAIKTEAPVPNVYDPAFCFIAQGTKQVVIDNEIFRYNPGDFLVITVDLPTMSQITKATKDKPYLILKIDMDLKILSDLVLQMDHVTQVQNLLGRGFFVGKSNDVMGDSILRLARLLATPEDIPILAPQIIREVFYRLLQTPYGSRVAQLALKGSQMQKISSSIQKIKQKFKESLSVDDLAELAGMSVSSFHAHFKSVTGISPLQFQKSLRLIEARRLMVVHGIDAASTAYQVGYESPSQFSREYARMFGNPPARDINILKAQ